MALAERTLFDLGGRSEWLAATVLPFSTTFVPAAGFIHEPMFTRLRATADALPSTETLPRQLHRLADRLDTESLESFLSPLTVHMPTRQPVGGNVTCCRRTGPVCRQSIGVYSGRRRNGPITPRWPIALPPHSGHSPPIGKRCCGSPGGTCAGAMVNAPRPCCKQGQTCSTDTPHGRSFHST